jgi:hypothetical protein
MITARPHLHPGRQVFDDATIGSLTGMVTAVAMQQ